MDVDSPRERGYAWRRRAREVYERDNDTCQRCGRERGKNGNDYTGLCVHHIVPGKQLPKVDARIDLNLVTVCTRCHDRLEDERVQMQFRATGREHAARTLDMLAEGRCTPAYLAEELDISPKRVRSCLSDLKRLGLVDQVHQRLYALADAD